MLERFNGLSDPNIVISKNLKSYKTLFRRFVYVNIIIKHFTSKFSLSNKSRRLQVLKFFPSSPFGV